MITVFISTDNVIEWKGLQRVTDDKWVKNATVTFTLKDTDGNAITGADGVSMPYLAGSDGTYQGTLPSTVSLTEGASYYLEVTATSSSGNGFRRIQCVARYRGET